MEDYVAADTRPLAKCLDDVGASDVYVGIFAWRYGSIPEDDNPARRSITELEYRKATELGKTRLIFLLADEASWKRSQMDEVTGGAESGARIRALRSELSKSYLVSFFETADQLAKLAVTAVANWQEQQKPRPTAPVVAARMSPSTSGPPEIPTSYRQWLLAQCSSLKLLGLRLRRRQAVHLNNVYVPLLTVAGHDPASEFEQRSRKRMEIPLERDEHTSLLLHRLGEFSLYVSGDPGAGKSTFCRWVTWLACEGAMPPPDVEAPEELQEQFPDELRGRLPLLVALRDFWSALPDPGKAATLSHVELEACLARWVDRTRPGGLTGADLLAHLAHGSALLMLERGEVPAWRNTLSFLYGKFLAASSTPERPVRLLTAVMDKLRPDAPSTLVGR